MLIRQAKSDDDHKICDVLRRSITELCSVDHDGRDEILLPWLENKTAENVRKWMKIPNNLMLVAEANENICGVGLVSSEGNILLNYVSPDYRFQGVSKAILEHLEMYLISREIGVVGLRSTYTARQFYSKQGFIPACEPQTWRGGKFSYPMEKRLKI